ncbi:protein MAIN-LIKE 1-like [Glycine max]|uniref:protein MAIN-LIKE 1-like n=1 Tax=Glycine max TaxID=3847 RepID=UPI00023D57EF|nr:protein MAIN-LIKE 1-like [Glycine max]|eukprot:XP_006601578.1 protein MAIN-LIKE 1-like [Glycine max]
MEAPAAVEDVVANIPADTGAEAVEDEHEGFPGGPSDPSVLTQYADHVACSVWTGEERPELKLSSHGRKVHSLGRPAPAIEGLVAETGLSPLITCSVDTGDRGLLSAFVERWHWETSSFHLPVGELTITLDDVSSLLHLPVIGDLHAFEPLYVDDAIQMLVDLLMVSVESVMAETAQCRGPYVRLQWARDIYERRCQAGHWTAAARAYLLHLLGCTLFANKSATNVHVVYLEALHDLSMTERYAWGVAALVHMYDQLNDASMSHNRQLGGYITLLQVDCDQEDREEHSYANVQGALGPTPDSGCLLNPLWGAPGGPGLPRQIVLFRSLALGSVAVYYRTERVVRQFGYTQTIPAPPVDSWVSYDDIHDRWMHYEDHIVPTGEVCVVSDQCSNDYMDWFFRISHPFMTPSHALDPLPHGHALQPRVVPQAPQTDIPHVPEPGASSTSAEEPRHAVRLERHLSLGVVTPGSSTHEVIEECLRLARSVTQDHLVYVRSRRRQRTDQA